MALVVNGRGIWGVRSAPSDAWTRPADWLAIPAIGTQEFIGLLAITDDEMNHIALLCAGAYTVDWGDGVIENFATNVKAQHTYAYSSISDNTISSRGYKQVLVRVTPQAGQNLVSINLHQVNFEINKVHLVGWLDMSINGSSITSLTLGGVSIYHGMCERVTIGTIGSISNLSNLFNNFHSLQSVNLFDVSNTTNFSNMFAGCRYLQSVPLLNTANGTNFSGMFSSCISISTIPLISTSQGTNFSSMFSSCILLETIPLLDTANGTNFSSMFSSCFLLETIPLLNTSMGINFSSMFNSCHSMRTVPLLNTANGTDFLAIFEYCTSLITIPAFNTSKGIIFSNMFHQCFSLNSIPLLDMSKGTNFTFTFRMCYCLQSLPNLNVSKGLGFQGIVSTDSLAKAAFQGTRYSIDYQFTALSKNAIVDVFNGLGTASGQTITITQNPGWSALSASDKLIATGKGWIIA